MKAAESGSEMEGAGRLGELGWGGGGGRQRAKRTCSVAGERPQSPAWGRGSLVHPAPTSTPLMLAQISVLMAHGCRLPSGDFLSAQRDRRWLWLLCCLAGTHLHLLLSSQARKHFLSRTSAGKGSPGQILQTGTRLGGKSREEVLGEGEILSQSQEG